MILISVAQMSSSENVNHIPTVILEIPFCYGNVFGADKPKGIDLNIVDVGKELQANRRGVARKQK